MGHNKQPSTQDHGEGSSTPLTVPNPHLRAWSPILRKVLALAFGGLGLAGLGALSMAQTPGPSPTTASNTKPNLANLGGAPEWLTPVSVATSSVPSAQPSSAAPCPPPHATSEQTPSTSSSSAVPSGAAVLPDGRVVLNLATSVELTTLPGIGQKRAEAILALRDKLHGFRKLSDLLRVKGIGVKSLKKLEPKLVLDAPNKPD